MSLSPTLPPGWPADLQRVRRFLPWLARPRSNGRSAKIPVRVDFTDATDLTFTPVGPTDPAHWLHFDQASTYVQAGQAAGVGLCFTRGCGWVAIDLDACIVSGRDAGTQQDADWTLTDQAARLLGDFAGMYAEISPSGTGIHLLVPGHLPAGWRRAGGVELIDAGFVTVTGRQLRPATGSPILDLAAWHARHAPRTIMAPPAIHSARASPATLDDLLRRATTARNGSRFQALWDGDLAGYRSRSEGDLALMMLLLFWTGDPADDSLILSFFHQSGRMRPDLTPTYLTRTLATARTYRARSSS